MEDNYYVFEYGGFPVYYSFLHQEILDLFPFESREGRSDCTGIYIHLTREYLEENRWLVRENEKMPVLLEFRALMLATSNALLSHRRALFHGAALLWKGRAWILTAPSGTGKTTQLRHWKKLLKSGAKIINGDKPLLALREDGTILVGPSPWRGKERYGTRSFSAPLGGIILLEQGDHNEMIRLATSDAVIPLFIEFISYPENAEQIRCQAEILDHVLRTVPVWKLVNLGDEESATLTLHVLEQYLEETNE